MTYVSSANATLRAYGMKPEVKKKKKKPQKKRQRQKMKRRKTKLPQKVLKLPKKPLPKPNKRIIRAFPFSYSCKKKEEEGSLF